VQTATSPAIDAFAFRDLLDATIDDIEGQHLVSQGRSVDQLLDLYNFSPRRRGERGDHLRRGPEVAQLASSMRSLRLGSRSARLRYRAPVGA
jgi:hypothetical protein